MGAIIDDSKKDEKEITPHLWAFIVPMAVVIVVTLWLDDILLWRGMWYIPPCFVLLYRPG